MAARVGLVLRLKRQVAPPPFRQTDDKKVELIQRDFSRVVQDLNSCPLLSGKQLTGIAVATTPTRISHGLGRPWKGWIVTDTNQSFLVYRPASATDDPSIYLTLASSTPSTISLWVY